jgi:hypothetical protein
MEQDRDFNPKIDLKLTKSRDLSNPLGLGLTLIFAR